MGSIPSSIRVIAHFISGLCGAEVPVPPNNGIGQSRKKRQNNVIYANSCFPGSPLWESVMIKSRSLAAQLENVNVVFFHSRAAHQMKEQNGISALKQRFKAAASAGLIEMNR